MSQYQYKAFISYSHKDTDIAEQIHRELEHYKVPGRLVGQSTGVGVVPKKLGSFFRDREELPVAEDLTTEVKKALGNSEFMIVLCSPSAAASRWVNREIIEFKKLHGDKYVLPLIIGGTPWASDSDKPEEECFPPAIRYKISPAGTLSHIRTEPIAADIKQGGDGHKRGVQKLIAGLLGVGLDRLVERELQRKQRRVMAVTSASVLGMIVMGGLTYQATTARQAAEQHRAEAEDLIEFMLTDLRKKLEPVGRLDVLDSVGTKAVSYYNGQDLDDIPDNAIGRRARAFHLLGEIQNQRGNRQEADAMFKRANEATEDLLARAPNNPQRIFEHSQSLYYVGYQAWQLGDYGTAEKAWNGYKQFSQQLVAIDPKNTDWQFELAYAHSNIGTLQLSNLFQPKKAYTSFLKSLKVFEGLASQGFNGADVKLEIAATYAWMADALRHYSHVNDAVNIRKSEQQILNSLISEDLLNTQYMLQLIVSKRAEAWLIISQGEIEAGLNILNTVSKIASELVEQDTENHDWLSDYSAILYDRAYILIWLKRIPEAYEVLKQVEIISEQLWKPGNENTKRTIYQKIDAQLVTLYARASEGGYEKALSGLENLASEINNIEDVSAFGRSVIGSLYLMLIQVYLDMGKPIEAQKLINTILEGKSKLGSIDTVDQYDPRLQTIIINILKSSKNNKIFQLLEADLIKRGYAIDTFSMK